MAPLNVGAMWVDDPMDLPQQQGGIETQKEQNHQPDSSNYIKLFHLMRRAVDLAKSAELSLDDAESCLEELLVQYDRMFHELGSQTANEAEIVITNLKRKIESSRANHLPTYARTVTTAEQQQLLTEGNYFELFHLMSRAKALVDSDKAVCIHDAESCLKDLLVQQNLVSHTLDTDKNKDLTNVVTSLQRKIDASKKTEVPAALALWTGLTVPAAVTVLAGFASALAYPILVLIQPSDADSASHSNIEWPSPVDVIGAVGTVVTGLYLAQALFLHQDVGSATTATSKLAASPMVDADAAMMAARDAYTLLSDL